MRYKNPVIPGFYPDPSVCRAGEDYYVVTSTFEGFPGVPVFHSRDLVHWRQIGHCLTRPSQLPLQQAQVLQGIYAPTIRYHDGTFYMITTNVGGGGHFYVTTDNPAGEWSEPIWIKPESKVYDFGYSIDSSLHFDDDGTVYFTCTGPDQQLFQAEIDITTGDLRTSPKLLFPGLGGKYTEAPHLYTINGMYYLMFAEGGTEYGHYEAIVRSNSPWGPWEHCPHNPILTHRSTDLPIQSTGHADLIQAHDGSWWLLLLATRPLGYPPAHHLGRETFLAPVTWTADGWPVVGDNGRVALDIDAACLPPQPWPELPARDDFDNDSLGLAWNYLRNPHTNDYSLTERPGWLRLRGNPLNLNAEGSPTLVMRRQQHFTCRVRTLLNFPGTGAHEEAGLVVLMNERHHYEIAVTGDGKVIVRRRIGSLSSVVAEILAPSVPLVLGIDAQPYHYTFLCGPDEKHMRVLASGETRYLSTEVASGFVGVRFGLYATGNGQHCSVPADFDWFDYQPLPTE